MPLDVLSKIQSFANGGSVDAGTKGAINQMIGDAQQNPALQSGLNGIANAVTNNGANINPDTMAQLARAGQAFSKAMEQANLAMLGIHGSFNSIDVTPLEKAEASLTGIAEHGKGISISIGTKGAESSLSSIANRIEKIRSSASIGVSVSTSIPRATSAPKPQRFATGGRITYHRQNTETAQTGGIFRHGSSTGDRNMIFANRGEGIITEKAVRQGARQRGMSPESYVQALNHPSTNLAMVKKGRSFSYGGLYASEVNTAITNARTNFTNAEAKSALQGLQKAVRDFPDGGHGTNPFVDELDLMLSNHMHSGIFRIPQNKKKIDAIASYFNQIKSNMEDDVKRQMGNLKRNSILSSSTSLTMPTATGGAITSASGVSMSRAISDRNDAMSQPSYSGPSTSISSAQSNDLKNSIRATSSRATISASNLAPGAESTLQGQITKTASEDLNKLNDFITKATSDQIGTLMDVLRQLFPTMVPEDLVRLFNDAQTNIDHLTEDQMQTIHAIASATAHTDFGADAKRFEREYENVKNEIINDLINGTVATGEKLSKESVRGIKSNIQSIIHDAITQGTFTDAQKENYKNIGAGVSAASQSRHASAEISSRLQARYGTDLETILRAKQAGGTELLTSTGLHNIDEMIQHAGDVSKIVLDNINNFKEYDEQISSVKDGFDKLTETSDEYIKKQLTGIPLIGKAFEGNVVGTMAMVGAIVLVGKALVDVSDKLKDVILKNSQLEQGMAKVGASVKLFSDGAGISQFKEQMNLTREQAGQLADAFRSIGVEGNVSFSQISTLAEGIKKQFGELDVSMLREAINLVKDLPTEQVEVLITGKGSLDDQANLIANLMSGGKLEMAADLIAKGAFGEVDGITPQMSEADKKIIELNAKIEENVDAIKGALISSLPAWLRGSAMVVAKTTAIGASILKMLLTNVWTGKSVAKLAMASHGTSIAVTSTPTTTTTTTPTETSTGMTTEKVVGIVGAVAITLGVIASILSQWRDEQKQENLQNKKISAKENEQLTGAYNSTYMIDDVSKQAATQGGMTFAKVGAVLLGVTAAIAGTAAAISSAGSALPLAIAGWGAAISAVTATIVGATDGIMEYSQLSAQNDETENFAITMKRLLAMEQYKQELLKKIGINTQDVKKSILIMEKLSKRNKMIGEGVYSAQNYEKANYGLNGIDLMSKIGGSFAGFNLSVRKAVDNSFVGAINDIDRSQRQKNEILNSDLDEDKKILELNDLRKNEIKVYERLINVLDKSIAQYEKIPSVIEASLKNSMASILLGNASGNFAGTSASASIVANNSGQATIKALQDTARQSNDEFNQLNNIMDELNEKAKENVNFISKQEEGKQENLQKLGLSKSTDEESALQNAKVVDDQIAKGDKILMNIAKKDTNAQNFAYIAEKGFENSKQWQEKAFDVEGMSEDEYKKEYSDGALKKFKEMTIASIDKDFEQYLKNSSQLDSVRQKEFLDVVLNNYNEAKKELSDAKSQKDLKAAINKLSRIQTTVATLFKEQSFDIIKRLPETQEFYNGEEGQKYGAAKSLESMYAILTDVTNARVLQEKKMSDIIQKSESTYSELINGWDASLKQVRNSADVLYYDILKRTREKSFSFDANARGSSAIMERNSFELKSLVSRKKSNQEARFQIEKYRNKWEEISKNEISKINNNDAQEYIRLIGMQAKARQDYLLNQTGENQQKLDETNHFVENFEREFADQIEKWKNGNDNTFKKALGLVGKYGSIVKSQIEEEAQLKSDIIDIIDKIPKSISQGIEFLPGVMEAKARNKRASAYGELAAQNVDFSGMISNLDEVAKYSAMERDIKINGLKEVRDAQIKQIDEQMRLLKENGRGSTEEYKQLEEVRKAAIIETDAEIVRAHIEANKKVIKDIMDSAEHVYNAIQRRTEGLEIEKDLYETIGAPFEYILDVEQELVRQAKDRADMAQHEYDLMVKNGATKEQLEQQELKVKKLSAEVIKASFGAQRDALDKLLGKMMGGFEQIGGIFGPDSDFMKARKAGQGYTQLPSGMISASGGTVTDYANRVAGLRGAAGMQNGVKMGRGDAGVFGNGRGIPGMANGGLFGDWISRQWKQLKEGMNNTVGNVSGDTGYAVTPNGNKVRMNRKEAIFNYDTLTALARPLGETPEQYVADALSGNPYSGIRAEASYTNMGHDMIFGRDRNRFRKYDDTTNETSEQAMARQLNEKRASALALGMEHQYRNENLIKKGEDGFMVAKDARGNSIASKTVKGNAESRMNATLRNSAFGGMAENAGSAGATLSSADKLLLAILEDTHKIVEAIGVEADWKKYEELANGLNKKVQKQQKLVKQEGDKNDKTDNELKKENDKIYGKKGKQNRLNAEQTARVSANNDKIAGHAYDAIARGSRTGAGEEKASVEQALDTDREILQYVKLIYDLLRQGGGFGWGSVVKSSMVSSHGAKTTIPKNEGNEESAPKFHAPSSVSATAIVAGISVAEKEIPKLVNGMNNIPKAMPKVTAFFKDIPQKASALEKGAMNWLGSSKAGGLAKATAGKMGNFGLGLSKWGNGLRDDFLLERAGELYGANEKGVSLASRTANRMGNWGLSLSKGKMGNFGLGLSKWGNGLRDDFLLERAGELYGANEKGVARTSRLANKLGEWTKNIGSKTGSRVGELASKVKNAEWVNKVANGAKGSTSSIVNGTKSVFARGLPRAPKRALIGTLGRSGATRTLNVAGKGMRFAGKGMRLAGRVAPYADLALAGYGAYKGWTEGATKEGVEEQMRNNHKNYGGEYFDAAGKHFKNGDYLKGIGNYAMGQGRAYLTAVDTIENFKNITMAGRLTYDTIAESYGQADRMKGMSAQSSALNARRAKRLGIKKSDYDAEVKMLLASEEGKKYRKRLEEKQNEDTGWFGDFTGNLLSFGGQNRAGKANVEDSVRMWADAQAKKNLSARQRAVEQSAKEAETAVARQSEEVRRLAGQIKEEAVKVASEQDAKSWTAGSYEGSSAGVAGVMNSELTSGTTRQYNAPVKEMNATVEPVQTHVQQGRGAYSGQSDTVAEKARDALSRIEAGQGQKQGEEGMRGGSMNVEVHITMDTKLFRAEVVKVARENIQSILNKPGTATV